MGLRDGNVIDITITATSPEKAQQIFNWIESGVLAMGRIDLETDWQRQSDDEG